MRLKAILACGILLLGSLPIYSQEVIRARRRSAGALTLAPGWTVLQSVNCNSNQGNTACSTGSSTYTMKTFPTTLGSVLLLWSTEGSNVTISATHGWTQCSPSCHNWVSSKSDGADLAYQTGVTAGTTSFSLDLSGVTANYVTNGIIEFMPPPGFTGSFDTAATFTNLSDCSSNCSMASLTTTGTDAIFQLNIGFAGTCPGGCNIAGWNAYSSPYLAESNSSNAIAINVTGGTVTSTFNQTGSAGNLWSAFSAIAFKSSAGAFTPAASTSNFSVKNFTNPTNSGNISSGTALTVPALTTGDLIFVAVETPNTSTWISSVATNGTALSWTVPTATGGTGCRVSFTGHAMSCAWAKVTTGGQTTITVTMTSAAQMFIGAYEFARVSGSFSGSADAIGSQTTTANAQPPGVTLSIAGTNDIAIQCNDAPGGTNALTKYYIPLGEGPMFGFNNVACQVYPNTGSSVPVPTWAWADAVNTSSQFGAAFQ